MKKLVMIMLTLFILTGCKPKVVEIPLIIYDMNDTYMEDFEARIVANASGIISIKTYDSQNSQIIQNEFIEAALKGGAKLLIVNPVDRLGAYTIIEKAKLYDAAIIFINREPLAEDLLNGINVYYVGADPIASAELQAEIVMELFGNNPSALNQFDINGDNIIQAVILKGEQGHQDAELRTEYVISTLKDNNYNLEVLDIKIANFDTATAKTAMDDLIELYGDMIEVVISNNDAMAIGAIQSYVANGYFTDLNENGIIEREGEAFIPIIGIDGLDVAVNLIETGYLYGTVINDSENMAKAIVELAEAILNEKDITSINYTVSDSIYIWIDYKKFTVDEN